MNLNVVSYNVLNPFHALKWGTPEGYVEIEGKRHDNWHREPQSRCARIFENLLQSNFDVACLQEVNPIVHNELKEWCSNHSIEVLELSLCYASPQDVEEKKLGVTILYNASRVECVAQNSYSSLAATESRGEVYGDFKLKNDSSIVRVCSTHLKGYDPTLHELDSEKYPSKQVQKLAGFQELQEVVIESLCNLSPQHVAVAICGDFNCHRQVELHEPHSRHAHIVQHGFTTDENETTSEARTERKIDWIYVKPIADKEIRLEPSSLGEQDLSASDHYLIGTTLRW